MIYRNIYFINNTNCNNIQVIFVMYIIIKSYVTGKVIKCLLKKLLLMKQQSIEIKKMLLNNLINFVYAIVQKFLHRRGIYLKLLEIPLL